MQFVAELTFQTLKPRDPKTVHVFERRVQFFSTQTLVDYRGTAEGFIRSSNQAQGRVALSPSLSLYLSLSLSLARARSLSLSLSLALSHSLSLALSISLSRSPSLSLYISLSLSPSRSLALLLSPSHTLARRRRHKHAWLFVKPVDPIRDGIPNYFEVSHYLPTRA